MLFDLSFLDKGKKWPPESELPRIRRYEENERLFLTEHAEVWAEEWKKVEAQFRKCKMKVDLVLNYHQLITKKTADFVCGDFPTIESEGDTDILVELTDRLMLAPKTYEAFIDVSRYGNGIFKHVGTSISTATPKVWFPVVSEKNTKEICFNVFGWPIVNETQLYVEIHSRGSVDQRWYELDKEKHEIGDLIKSEVASVDPDISTVLILTNITHSSSLFGIDDYVIINSLIKHLMWRLHCVDLVLDKHAEPSMVGPESALAQDPRTGEYFVPLGNYFVQAPGENKDPKYLTWDGNLDAAYKEIDFIISQLYILSEMGQAFIDGGGQGSAESGTALKLRMVSPRIKAKRIVNLNKGAFKILLADLAKLNHIDVKYKDLSITWNDGLPVDEVEETNRLVAATGGKAIMSQYAAIKSMGKTDTEVEAELKQMQKEDATSSPYVLGSVLDPNSEADI